MAGHLLFNSGSNESSLAPQFKWLDNTFKLILYSFSSNRTSFETIQYLLTQYTRFGLKQQQRRPFC